MEAIESKRSRELEQRSPSIQTISVHELEGSGNEAVVQICTKKEKAEEFSNLLHVLEVQGFSILSASTTQVCRGQKVVCYHFHVKVCLRLSLPLILPFLFDLKMMDLKENHNLIFVLLGAKKM